MIAPSFLVLAALSSGLPPSMTSTRAGSCDECHDARGWRPARFDHSRRVGYPLTGRHAEAGCHRCHTQDLREAVPRSCDGCHADPHRGDLGMHCASCHDTIAWTSRFSADAHRRTAFPLSGAHAALPCEDCHDDRFSNGFRRAAARCVDCHRAEVSAAAMTSLDHEAAGFGDDCARCHTPWRFSTATFPEHERCFQIAGGEHAGIRCRNCHLSVDGLRITGSCETRNASCTSCHEHDRSETDEEHRGVPGYQYEDRKCYECHRFASN